MATLRVDDLVLPSFPPFVKDACKHISDIENFPTRKDDILLFNYPKSGKFCSQENSCFQIRPLCDSRFKLRRWFLFIFLLSYLKYKFCNNIWNTWRSYGLKFSRSLHSFWFCLHTKWVVFVERTQDNFCDKEIKCITS